MFKFSHCLLAQNCSSNSTLDATGHCISVFPSRYDLSLDKLIITSTSVAKAISNLDPSTASGPDNIPVTVLQKCSPELSAILSKLFNKYLADSSFPSSWKTAAVVPIFKDSGDRSDPFNYRPISLSQQQGISKIFESLINKVLISNMESTGLFYNTQYGFSLARSTAADMLTLITGNIYHALDKCGEAKLIALDISKVCHKGLLYKLRTYDVSGKVFDINKSFLSNRSLKIVLDGQHSSTCRITSEVPQRSILGPLN